LFLTTKRKNIKTDAEIINIILPEQQHECTKEWFKVIVCVDLAFFI